MEVSPHHTWGMILVAGAFMTFDLIFFSPCYHLCSLVVLLKTGREEAGCSHCSVLSQIIQRQLEQVEEKQRQLEERGVAVEKALRGEAGTACESSVRSLFLKEGPPPHSRLAFSYFL